MVSWWGKRHFRGIKNRLIKKLYSKDSKLLEKCFNKLMMVHDSIHSIIDNIIRGSLIRPGEPFGRRLVEKIKKDEWEEFEGIANSNLVPAVDNLAQLLRELQGLDKKRCIIIIEDLERADFDNFVAHLKKCQESESIFVTSLEKKVSDILRNFEEFYSLAANFVRRLNEEKKANYESLFSTIFEELKSTLKLLESVNKEVRNLIIDALNTMKTYYHVIIV